MMGRIELTDVCRVQVKFSEVDSMRVVWHGNYVMYFEDGRESFGRRFPGMGYEVMQERGIYAPIYDVHLRHYASLRMGDVAVVHTTLVPHRGARLDYKYSIYRESDGALCCEGETTQLFIAPSGELMLQLPDFVEKWMEKWMKQP